MRFMPVLMSGLLLLSLFPVTQSNYNLTEAVIKQINEELLEYYLTTLVSFGPRYTGSEQCYKAEEWVYEEFLSMGLNVSYYEWKMGGFEDRNIVATLPGEDEYIVIIGAHMDTTENSPGADDNGSGVAAVLAIAKILSQYRLAHTIRFLVYTGEEVGTYGSYSYARHVYENGEKIIAVLNPDMVGYADTAKGGRYMRFFETERAKWITDFAIDVSNKYYELLEMNVERVPNYPGADHQAYLEYGYDAVFMAHYDGYRYGHSQNDSIDKINFTYETKAARFLAAILVELANKPVKTYVEIKEPKEGYLYILDHAIMPVVSRTWYLGMRGVTIIIGRVTVLAEVDGEVEKVIFAIDDRMWRWDYSPPYEWKINVMTFGKHYIKVYAYGDEIARDEMDIIALIPYIP